MSEEKTYLRTREFLNIEGHHTIAAITSLVVYDPIGIQPSSYDVDYILSISDCSRSVSLAFDAELKNRENNLHKIDLLISAFQDFKSAMIESFTDLDQRAADYEAANPKENDG